MKKFFFVLLFALTANAQEHLTTGPENGTLVIVGGGRVVDTITKKYIELAGGIDAPMVVIPTAGGDDIYGEDYYFAERLRAFGVKKVTVVHTYDRAEADTEAFTQPLKDAKAVWFGGGRQWRLVDAYADTKTEQLIWEVLNKGGVIGGSSAGATIQGSYLARGDTQNNQIMMGDHEEGFGFIKNIAIDQHVLARNRQFDMFNILKNRPELLGIGIDESTAVIVKGDQFEVVGASKVLIYDGTFWSREGSQLKNLPSKDNLFYFLQSGDRYDMKSRSVVTD
ncbi:cyanophycinase [Aggregatimonas sangjinii]|uniref:Cyanophycinase n=1 Tax=Aggregatimonas sangjinii TaxID=2583587 RepID=A0A5B7SU38_9FLAO|nr:cyanophycinase [Aggregatimonas sangjinii]QCX00411.1 cyanophycinase [Aggregatimonas sangjinii]